MPHWLARLLIVSAVAAAVGCTEQPATALADASLYKVGGNVRVLHDEDTVAASEGMKLKPTDVIEVPEGSVALVLCANGYLVKVGAGTKRPVSKLDACTLEPTSDTPEAQATALLSPSEIPLLAEGERVAAADARLHGGVAGTATAIETADEAQRLAARDEESGEMAEGVAPAAEDEAPAAAKPSRKQRVADRAQVASSEDGAGAGGAGQARTASGDRASQAPASNSKARALLARGDAKTGSLSAASAEEKAPAQDAVSPVGGLADMQRLVKPGFTTTKGRAKKEVTPPPPPAKQDGKLGITGRAPTRSATLELRQLVNANAAVRKCLASALGDDDKITVSLTTEGGKVVKVAVPKAKRKPACITKELEGRVFKGVPDGTVPVTFKRADLVKK